MREAVAPILVPPAVPSQAEWLAGWPARENVDQPDEMVEFDLGDIAAQKWRIFPDFGNRRTVFPDVIGSRAVGDKRFARVLAELVQEQRSETGSPDGHHQSSAAREQLDTRSALIGEGTQL
ncbi:hypothetical protein Aple_042570 [Acrocarpospora pleiomorpha]|uniref:Uncharacterized protein n=1 Tax=Acrocarpospora pleiomorpha TaxID=90975 RepID=A0A5M3XNY7_9ACTN|nr:hypothetical protein Aple_042570 [Acrocarpospora pleiomorpha]